MRTPKYFFAFGARKHLRRKEDVKSSLQIERLNVILPPGKIKDGYGRDLNKGMKKWIKAFRLRTLPLTLACISVGISLAYFYSDIDLKISLLIFFTTLFLQILSNLANDYGDFVKQTDNNERLGEERTMQSGMISTREMKRAIVLFSFLSFATGFVLLWIRFDFRSLPFLIFLILGLGAIAAAIKYTIGKKPYGYQAMGDVFVFIFFGPVAVIGSFYLNTLTLDPWLLFPAAAMGFFSAAVLNVNNMRDINTDRKAGKVTIPVLWGLRKAKIYHYTLILLGFVMFGIFTETHYHKIFQWLFLFSIPVHVKILTFVATKDNSLYDPLLKKTAVAVLISALLFSIGIML